ncbi:MAG: SGNH/GDSL hydrolase family protein [Bacteroidota bacterium]|nr:SGNH/GDSL hydrolase family protein [Bacteroidota bacterium]
MRKCLFILIAIIFFKPSFAQQKITWHEPSFVEGVGTLDSTNIFHRLPIEMKDKVRQPVWNLSENTAGEFIHFKTSATEIKVKYTLTGKDFAMSHMPATGVSGLDLYAIDINGNWNWAPGSYHFGDTCTYHFKNLLLSKNSTSVSDFYLYLPLYNSVKWLSLGVDKKDSFSFAKKRKEQPIVAYGTSIMQGAVASRPGLAWTNILERNLDRTVINLGFSGNGRFEAPIFDLMASVNAKIYILDCMPNLTKGVSYEEIKNRVIYGVNKLRKKNKATPILFAEHAVGHGRFYMDTARLNEWHNSSLVIEKNFNELKSSDVKNIYLLTDEEIDFDINSTTEGLHPNDIGMMKYATAYEKKIREILNEPIGEISTKIPVQQCRDGYNWIKRHEEIIARIKETKPNTLLIGNSIINYFGGEPAGMVTRGEKEWNKYLAPLKVQNCGYGWDRIENVLWRIYHGELDHFTGANIVLMIGTNNLSAGNTDSEIVEGLQFLIKAIQSRKPQTRLVIAGILPRKNMERRACVINRQIKKMALQNHTGFVDFGKDLLKGNSINPQLFLGDGLHPNAEGYRVLGENLNKLLTVTLK